MCPLLFFIEKEKWTMIQEMTEIYWTELFIGYVKAGVIGWIVWFAMALLYVLWSFKLNLEMYRTEGTGDKKKKLSLRGFLSLVLWPWGMLASTHSLVKHVTARLSGKE